MLYVHSVFSISTPIFILKNEMLVVGKEFFLISFGCLFFFLGKETGHDG